MEIQGLRPSPSSTESGSFFFIGEVFLITPEIIADISHWVSLHMKFIGHCSKTVMLTLFHNQPDRKLPNIQMWSPVPDQ